MKVLRAIASLFVFLILGFFLIGLGSSNDWEGGGTLAKIVLIPICLVLGLLLFKLAAPLFSYSPSTRVSPNAEAQTREKIADNRYRMGNDLPTSYALTVLGLVLLFVSISREDTTLGIVSLAVFLFSFRMRGRLQTERNIAKSIGARTFANDIEDTVVGAAELAGTAAKFVLDKGVSSFQQFVAEDNQNTPEEGLVGHVERQMNDPQKDGNSMSSFEQTGARNLLIQMGWTEEQMNEVGPIGAARELLLLTWHMFSSDSSQQGVASIRIVIYTAMRSLAWALNNESELELMPGARILDKDDALMWYGICAGLLVHPGYVIPDLGYGISRPTVLSNTDAPDIIALAAAYESYIRRGDLQRAGRCAQELYEIMRHWSADKETEYWRTAAAMMFEFAELPDRSAALQKSKEQEELLSSPFFYRAFGPGGSTSVAGSIEYVTMAQETNVTIVKKTNVFPKNVPSGSSNQAGLDWFQIDQKVLFKDKSDTGVIVGYHGGDLVSVKVDSGPDAGGSDIVLISWDEIEKLPTTES